MTNSASADRSSPTWTNGARPFFDRDGKILEWSGNSSHGRVERKYIYDDGGKLIRISGSNGDYRDEFRYDERGRKTRIRVVPARPEQDLARMGSGLRSMLPTKAKYSMTVERWRRRTTNAINRWRLRFWMTKE